MGLDRELFTGEVGEEFLCGLCSQVLLNPVTTGCEHIFCQSCVVRKVKSRVSKPECPECNATISLNMADTSVEFKLKLLNLIITCTHKCGESFVLAELPDHMEICPNAPVDCEFRLKGCKRKVKRCDKRKHQDECDYRPVECEACGHQTIYRELFTHQSRVRCLEKKLKQQIIRERKAASREINRHREKLFRDNVRLDQHQRKKLVSHAKSMSVKKNNRKMSKDEVDSEFEFSTGEVVFLSEDRVQEYNEQLAEPEEKTHTELPHHVSSLRLISEMISLDSITIITIINFAINVKHRHR